MYQVLFRSSDYAILQAHSSAITEITVNSVKFCHSLSDVDCFPVLYNETVFLYLTLIFRIFNSERQVCGAAFFMMPL